MTIIIGFLFQPGVREVVANTYILESIWKAVDPSYWTYTLYRYYGSSNGVFRKYPATSMPKEYDPTKRPWLVMFASLYRIHFQLVDIF